MCVCVCVCNMLEMKRNAIVFLMTLTNVFHRRRVGLIKEFHFISILSVQRYLFYFLDVRPSPSSDYQKYSNHKGVCVVQGYVVKRCVWCRGVW